MDLPPDLSVAPQEVVDLSVGLRMEVARQLLEGTEPQEASANHWEVLKVKRLCAYD